MGRVRRTALPQAGRNLTLLAPDIQEDILFLPRVAAGRDPITERHLRPIVAILDWHNQRPMWREVKNAAGAPGS